MRTAACETAADHVADRTDHAAGLPAPFEIVDEGDDLQLRLSGEPLVAGTRGGQVHTAVAASRAAREAETHDEACLRPAVTPAAERADSAFAEAVEAVSVAVVYPHRLDIERFTARLVENADAD